MRGAATHRASGQAGLTDGVSQETVDDTPAQGVTQNGGYVECSPRRNSTRIGLEEYHDVVDIWLELVVGQRAHWDVPGVRHSALGDTATRRESAPQGWSKAGTRAMMARVESRGGTVNTTHHGQFDQCVWAIRPTGTSLRGFILVPGHQGGEVGGGGRGSRGGGVGRGRGDCI